MDLWITEEEAANLRYSYRVKSVLHSSRSKFQKIDVVDTHANGRMLFIDDMVMTTDADEFVYHEVIAHIPVCLHPDPKRVVVIGGGDGGTVRELARHSCLESIVLCEIDEEVVNVSRKFFPDLTSKLDDPRVSLNIGDGLAYIRDHEPSSLDLVIVDSTDPIGPGEGLFTREFYASVARALKSDGIMIAQSESPWYDQKLLARVQKNISGGFQHLENLVTSVPTYPRGYWSWTIAANRPIQPVEFDRGRLGAVAADLRFLNDEMFTAVFAKPNFYKQKIGLS